MSQLQTEGLRVESSKATIGSLAKEIQSRVLSLEKDQEPGNEQPGTSTSQESVADLLKGKERELGEALHYLLKNRENLSKDDAIFIGQFSEPT